MAQVLHGYARTMQASRFEIQHSQESVRTLAKRYGLSPTTVQKWRSRSFACDAPMEPKMAHSSTLTRDEEATVAALRRQTRLPLDDCLYALQPVIPHLTRSSLHCYLKRHGLARLPKVTNGKPVSKKFKVCPIGFIHIDIAEVRTSEGKAFLFVAIDRTSKFVVARLEETADRAQATAFLQEVIDTVPYHIRTVLTDNGLQFCHPTRHRAGPTARFSRHLFDRLCHAHGIEHRLTQPNHPWTNGQAERMNRTLKEATVGRYHYETAEQLSGHLALFITAYNHAKRLRTLQGLTPYECLGKLWTQEPQRFKRNPYHDTLGPNI